MNKTILTSAFATGIMLAIPIGTEAALGDQTLRVGMSHPDVKELQDLLKEKGFFTYHTSTGFYGTITEEAVKKFQQAHKIQMTGVAGPQTLNALLANNSTAAASRTEVTLTVGASGQAVTELQQKLKERGHFNHQVTGYFGRITTAAVKSFQEKHDLPVTGTVTEETLAALTNQPLPEQPVVYQPTTNISSSTSQATFLRLGSEGESVRLLQQQLQELGLFADSLTSTFTKSVEQAVRRFQQQSSLTVDGVVGPQTRRALEQAIEKKPAAATLKVGVSGQAITELQAQLRQLGFFDREPTGNFGSVTEAAVRQFQRANNLPETGEVTEMIRILLTDLTKSGEKPNTNASNFNVMNMIADASELVGTPYLWAGSTPDGFDCSGFLQYVFAKSGMTLPRTIAEMWNVGKDTAEPKVGDLVFFETYTTGPSHAGIYIGNNQFVHSGTSTGVTVASMQSAYWSERYLGVKSYY